MINTQKESRPLKIYDYEGRKNLCGQKIRSARLAQKMTQEELAAKMQLQGVTIERDSISRIEIGTRFVPDYEIPLFAAVLNVSVEWLLAAENH